jgi:hypothetical protein
MKILVLKDKIFLFSDPLKSTSFFFLTLQNLVYFSGPTIGENLALKVISGPPKYTSLIH